jgi:SAM-dependent methyltransferase
MVNTRKRKYYEQTALWEINYLETYEEGQRIRDTIEMIPPDVQSILDVGCGNGAFINILANKYKRVVGLDLSHHALKYVKGHKVQSDVAKPSFKPASFDLVTCLEVLEHLSQEEFENALYGLLELASKYIIITVPNNENLRGNVVMCPKCYCRFNPAFHVRSFSEKSLHQLLENCVTIQIKEIGPRIRVYQKTISDLFRLFKTPSIPANVMCPQCGHRNISESGLDKVLASKLNPVSKFWHRMKLGLPYWGSRIWLLGLYKKSDA